MQCSVFQIRTPAGEVFTLPIQEIASVHALSENLVQRMEQAAQAQAAQATPGVANAGDGRPFGFAAFTSLSRSEQNPPASEADAQAE